MCTWELKDPITVESYHGPRRITLRYKEAISAGLCSIGRGSSNHFNIMQVQSQLFFHSKAVFFEEEETGRFIVPYHSDRYSAPAVYRDTKPRRKPSTIRSTDLNPLRVLEGEPTISVQPLIIKGITHITEKKVEAGPALDLLVLVSLSIPRRQHPMIRLL